MSPFSFDLHGVGGYEIAHAGRTVTITVYDDDMRPLGDLSLINSDWDIFQIVDIPHTTESETS